jgi:hypothetical protein
MLGTWRRGIMSTGAQDKLRQVVAVIGTTGVGKSQLAIYLATSLSSNTSREGPPNRNEYPKRAVIFSADSMQLYRGLDVITNKVTREEMGGVEHWGLDMVTPGEGGSWDVGKWYNEADQKVSHWPSYKLIASCPPWPEVLSQLSVVAHITSYSITSFLRASCPYIDRPTPFKKT